MSDVMVRVGRVAMGSEFEVIAWGDDRQHLLAAAEEALDEVQRLDRQLSHYDPSSDISHLNRRAAVEPVRVEPHLFRLLQRCASLTHETAGAFDITAGPLIRCWGFLDRRPALPAPAAVAAALKLVGVGNVVLDQESLTVRYARAGVEINLGAVGKGYAVEQAGAVLRELGVQGALLHGGRSSIQAVGTGPQGEPWNVALRHPFEEGQRLTTIALQDCAMSTSGSTGDYFESDGRRFSHLLDPRTGWPAEGTVVASAMTATGTESDALSTALFVMGAGPAASFCAAHPEIAALLVEDAGPGTALEIRRFGIEFEEDV